MKRKLFLITGILTLVFAVLISGYTQSEGQIDGPQIVFDKEIHDFGIIYVNGDGTCFFILTNTGNEPLILTNVRAGCGCTVPDWPRKPIMPGDTAIIQVEYITLNRPHKINRSIVVTSNAINKPVQMLRLRGTIIKAPSNITPEKQVGKTTRPPSR